MTRRHAAAVLAALPLSALPAALAPAPAAAGPLGFSDPVVAGEHAATEVAAGVGADGTAVLAAVGRGPRDRVEVVRRHGADRPFTAQVAADGLADARDPQAAVAPGGVVVAAWAEVRDDGRGAVALLTARAGAAPRVRRFRVASGTSAFPRLAVLRSGTVLLAFRDAGGGRVRVVRGDGPPRTVATRASRIALAASGAGAHLAWVGPARRARAPRTLRVARLGDAGRRIPLFDGHDGSPLVVSRDAGGDLRLAGGRDGRAIAAWTRPRRGDRAPAAFTRSLWPVAPRAAQPVRLADGRMATGTPALVLGADGLAVLAVRAVAPDTGGVAVASLESRAGSAWVGLRSHGGPWPMTGIPRPVLAGGDALVVFSAARAQPGAPVHDLLVAARADDGPGGEARAAGTGLQATDGRGVAVASAGARVLVAWPAPEGGVALAERS